MGEDGKRHSLQAMGYLSSYRSTHRPLTFASANDRSAGNHISPPIPPEHAQTDPRISENKHPHYPILHSPQVPPVLSFSEETGTKDCAGDPARICSERTGVL